MHCASLRCFLDVLVCHYFIYAKILIAIDVSLALIIQAIWVTSPYRATYLCIRGVATDADEMQSKRKSEFDAVKDGTILKFFAYTTQNWQSSDEIVLEVD